MSLDHIRNFSIIAHIDHGKSTLADRMLEVTKTIEARKMRAQVLDAMDLERERGITIKMQPVRMVFHPNRPERSEGPFILNLIDTPGHIDFGYEVSRALTAVEGVLLLVDATQGVQAQTLATLQMARDAGCVIVPVVTKTDSPLARTAEVRASLATLLAVDESTVYEVSGRTGAGVGELLNGIVTHIPPPRSEYVGTGGRALVFDFSYSEHRGIVAYLRVMDGTISLKQSGTLSAVGKKFVISDLGYMTPQEMPAETLSAGEIGYVVTSIKEPGVGVVGDTMLTQGVSLPALSGYANPRPVVWASVYPESQDDFTLLKHALQRLKLSDAALSFEEDGSSILGKGFRCGFLGMLHMEIVTERLRREFNIEPVITSPSITYEVTTNKKDVLMTYSPTMFPNDGTVETVREQWVVATIMVPPDHLSALTQLLYEHEGAIVHTELFDTRLRLTVDMPLRELMRGFFDSLKSATQGFASLSYEFGEWRSADVVRMDVLVAEELVPAFSRVVSRRRLETDARAAASRLKTLLPRQMFVVKIQAKADGRIVASESISALRKDVTGYLYGGDVTRKMKLLEKQKKGKERRGEQGSNKVHIPQDVFLKMIKPKD